MITTSGKQIVAKYLLGQAPAFASHIAAGCGAKPLSFGDEVGELDENKKSLDFEIFRVPIIARGFLKEIEQVGEENVEVEKIVFKAEMPTDQRFNITEVALFPAQSNSVASQYDSKLLITFSPSENWTEVLSGSGSAIQYPNLPLDDDNNLSNISIEQDIIFINSDTGIFNNQNRENRLESPRFLNRSLIVAGNSASINSQFEILESSKYIENSAVNFDFSRNTPIDEIRLALSLLSKEASDDSNPSNVRIVIELINNIPGSNFSSKAVANIGLTDEDFEDSRYVVVAKKLSEFTRDINFSFGNVNLIKIYVSVIDNEVASDQYYVVLDGMRLENFSSLNPLYSMVAYESIKTQDGQPILKVENTSNYIEYRFSVGIS
jgi:hypothetical protein